MKTFEVYENSESEYLGQIHGPDDATIERAKNILKISSLVGEDVDLRIVVGERKSKGFLIPMTRENIRIKGWYI